MCTKSVSPCLVASGRCTRCGVPYQPHIPTVTLHLLSTHDYSCKACWTVCAWPWLHSSVSIYALLVFTSVAVLLLFSTSFSHCCLCSFMCYTIRLISHITKNVVCSSLLFLSLLLIFVSFFCFFTLFPN